MTNKNYDQIFTRKIIKYGRMTNLLATLFCFLPAIVLSVVFNATPPIESLMTGWITTLSIFGVYYFVEPISYFPILGIPGTYMSFLAGNIGNMRVPSAAVAQEALGVEMGTKKAELVATLGIAGSVITNIIVVTAAAFGGAALLNVFPPAVLSAFEFVTPAIFGAMFGMFANKALKFGLFAVALALILLYIGGIPQYVMIPITVFSTVTFAILDSKKKNK